MTIELDVQAPPHKRRKRKGQPLWVVSVDPGRARWGAVWMDGTGEVLWFDSRDGNGTYEAQVATASAMVRKMLEVEASDGVQRRVVVAVERGFAGPNQSILVGVSRSAQAWAGEFNRVFGPCEWMVSPAKVRRALGFAKNPGGVKAEAAVVARRLGAPEGMTEHVYDAWCQAVWAMREVQHGRR